MQLLDRQCIMLAAGTGRADRAAGRAAQFEILFKPMISWVYSAVAAAGISKVVAVTAEFSSPHTDKGWVSVECCEHLPAGSALSCARNHLQEADGNTLILYADIPFVRHDVIESTYRLHLQKENCVTAATFLPPANDSTRDAKNAAPAVDLLWIKTELLNALLDAKADRLDSLDEVVQFAAPAGNFCHEIIEDSFAALRGDSPAALLTLNEAAAAVTLEKHLKNGVFLVSRDGVLIGPDVTIEPCATILPGTSLQGNTKIGQNCIIGPHSTLIDTTVGEGSRVDSSRLVSSVLGKEVHFGPYSQLRENCTIGDHAKIGDFVEIKNATIGTGTSVAHLTYIGDADIGSHCNFGCGTVFANYDGAGKYRTAVGDYVFLGCHTTLIAPVSVGDGAYTAAGTTVTKDIPAGALAISRTEQVNKPEKGMQKLEHYIQKKKSPASKQDKKGARER